MKKLFSILMFTLGFVLAVAVGLSFAGTLPASLTWTNTNTVDKLTIQKSPTPTGAFTEIAQVLAGQTNYTDATNDAGTSVCYRVAYFNTSGVGPFAGPVCKTFPSVPTQTPGALQVQ